MYCLIVERLADGILGMKHGVAAFVIQFLNAAACCYQVDRVLLVVRHSTEQRFWQLTIRVLDGNKKNIYYLVWPSIQLLVAHWPGIVHKLTVIWGR